MLQKPANLFKTGLLRQRLIKGIELSFLTNTFPRLFPHEDTCPLFFCFEWAADKERNLFSDFIIARTAFENKRKKRDFGGRKQWQKQAYKKGF